MEHCKLDLAGYDNKHKVYRIVEIMPQLARSVTTTSTHKERDK